MTVIWESNNKNLGYNFTVKYDGKNYYLMEKDSDDDKYFLKLDGDNLKQQLENFFVPFKYTSQPTL